MAARKRRTSLDEEWRGKIKTSMLVNRLNENAMGNLPKEMTASQVKSAEILLRKVAPDLSATDHTGEIEHSYVARVPAPQPELSTWQQQHDAKPPTIQ